MVEGVPSSLETRLECTVKELSLSGAKSSRQCLGVLIVHH